MVRGAQTIEGKKHYNGIFYINICVEGVFLNDVIVGFEFPSGSSIIFTLAYLCVPLFSRFFK